MTTTFKYVQAEPAEGQTSPGRSAIIGDGQSFVALYDRYARAIYNMALRSARDRQLAEDICQEVWLKVHRHLANLRDEEAFASWLYRIAARTCISAARVRAAGPQGVELTEMVSDGAAGPESACLGNEEVRLVWEALGSLAPRQHIALYLREVEGRSYDQIAKALDTSHSAVETLLFRARLSLAKSHVRLEASPAERCREAARSMAAVLDQEATPVQKRALEAHLGGCSSCRQTMGRVRAASVAYAAIPLAHVPTLVTTSVFESAALVAVGEILTKGGLTALLAKVKGLALVLIISGGLTTGSEAVGRFGLGLGPAASSGQAASVSAAGVQDVSRNDGPSHAQATAPTLEPDLGTAAGGPRAAITAHESLSAPASGGVLAAQAQVVSSRGPNSPTPSVGVDLAAASVSANPSIGGASAGIGVQAGVSVRGAGVSAASTVRLAASVPAAAASAGVTTGLNARPSSGVTTGTATNASIAVPAGLAPSSGSLAGTGSATVSASQPGVQTTDKASGTTSVNQAATSANTSLNSGSSSAAVPTVVPITESTSLLGH